MLFLVALYQLMLSTFFADLTAELLTPSAAMPARNPAGRGYATANARQLALAFCGEIPATRVVFVFGRFIDILGL